MSQERLSVSFFLDVYPAGCSCRYNDRNYRWVAEDTWTFQAEFNMSQSELGQQQVDLVLYGVDSVAEVYLNDQLLGSLDNAFR